MAKPNDSLAIVNLFRFVCCGMAIMISSSVAAQERFVPSTVSKEAAEIIRSFRPGNENAASKAEWQALWEENQKAIQPAVEEARQRYPAKIEKKSIAGADHLLI